MSAPHPSEESSAPPSSVSGRELTLRLEGIGRGDDAARRWLHETYAPRLARRLRARYARHRALDVDELLQDSFLHFYQHAPGTFARFLDDVPVEQRSEGRLDGYLWDVACGIASNRLRSARRRPPMAAVAVETIVDPADTERGAVERDALTKLMTCLKRAGSRSFLYYMLRFVDGLTPEEISQATGWSRKATYKLRLALVEAIDRCARRLGLR